MRARSLLNRCLLRGESVVAPAGIALAFIFVSAMGVAAWWNERVQLTQLRQLRFDHVRPIGRMLKQTAEALLASGEISSLRRLVVETAMAADLDSCGIVLLDGTVIADSDPSRISVSRVDQRWPTGEVESEDESLRGGQVRLVYELHVPQRGQARLLVTARTAATSVVRGQAQAGAALSTAVALAGLLVVYRRTRFRVSLLGEIRQTLRAVDQGEQAVEALQLSPTLGPEAEAWNRIMAENDRLRQQQVAERSGQAQVSGESSADLVAACDALNQGLLLLDGSCITYANGAAARFCSVRREDLIGSQFDAHIQDAQLAEAIAQTGDRATWRRVAVEVERPGEDEAGGDVLRFTIRPMVIQDVLVTLLIIEDITQQRVAESSRHAFVAQATHELRTPLTNIRLSAETAIDLGDEDPKLRSQCLNAINHATRRLERMVSQMLSIAQIEAGAISLARDDVRMGDLLNELMADYQPHAQEKSIGLSLEMAPKLPVIQADRDLVTLVLQNLIGNAMKYTPDGGKVQVTVEPRGGVLAVTVADSGIGISESDAPRIFEKFYRADDKRVHAATGSGLGLAVAREVARLHGGDITLQSQLNEGSTFTFTILAGPTA